MAMTWFTIRLTALHQNSLQFKDLGLEQVEVLPVMHLLPKDIGGCAKIELYSHQFLIFSDLEVTSILLFCSGSIITTRRQKPVIGVKFGQIGFSTPITCYKLTTLNVSGLKAGVRLL